MFNFIKIILGLNDDEQKIFDFILKPYIIYSIINIIFMILSHYNIGKLNEDVFGGLFISWIIYTFTLLIVTFGKE